MTVASEITVLTPHDLECNRLRCQVLRIHRGLMPIDTCFNPSKQCCRDAWGGMTRNQRGLNNIHRSACHESAQAQRDLSERHLYEKGIPRLPGSRKLAHPCYPMQ